MAKQNCEKCNLSKYCVSKFYGGCSSYKVGTLLDPYTLSEDLFNKAVGACMILGLDRRHYLEEVVSALYDRLNSLESKADDYLDDVEEEDE